MRCSVDGTDFVTTGTYPFDPKWYSHKSNGPGLRYEKCLNIQTGNIVWVNGPFPPGEWLYIVIARYMLIHELLPNKMVIANGGYNDNYQYFITPTGRNTDLDYMMAVVRAHHETINRCFKTWAILSNMYHHDKNKHGVILGAIVELEQLKAVLFSRSNLMLLYCLVWAYLLSQNRH